MSLKNPFIRKNRTTKAVANIIGSFVIKGLSILSSLILIPLTLNYLTPYEYGVWLTLSSTLAWIDYFDIGLGSGLRNKLSEALSQDNLVLAKKYVSTTFFLLLLISFILFILFIFLNQWLDWGGILNLTEDIGLRISQMIWIVFLGVIIAFVLKIVTYIYFAKQLPVINSSITLLSQLISLLLIYFLTYFRTEDRLEWIAYIYSFSPVLILSIFFIITFTHYKYLCPSLNSLDIKLSSGLMNLGLKFFFIQISCLLIYTTSNLIISRNLSPDEVTPYSIAFRYFNILFMVFSIIISPMWNAVNEAYNKEDYQWIVKTISILNKFILVISLCAFIMLICSKFIYKLWIGSSVIIPFNLNLALAIYVLILIYSSLYSHFLNGMNKLNLQLYVIVIMGIIFVPLASFLSKEIGTVGVAISLCIVNTPGAIINHIQYKKIINSKIKKI